MKGDDRPGHGTVHIYGKYHIIIGKKQNVDEDRARECTQEHK